jgi:hypothetical protein
VLVGAGEGPCWILMVGARRPDRTFVHPADPTAARHGAAADRATSDAREAHGKWTPGCRAGANTLAAGLTAQPAAARSRARLRATPAT